MTKAELITQVARESDITKKSAGIAVDSFIQAIHDSLKKKNGSIHVASLGTFKVVQKQARLGVNPRTQEKMNIPAKKAPSFSPSKSLRESVMGGGKTARNPGLKKSSAMDELKCKICGLPVVGKLPFCKDHQRDAC